jgi:hypothetical protein
MTAILTKRVAFITLIFGAFGGALTLLLKIQEMQSYYPALGALIALLTSLLVSFLIIGKRNSKVMRQFKIAAALLFACFLACAVLHTRKVINHTFEYVEFDETNRYVKGNYSDSGLAIKKRYPTLNDEEILRQKMGGVDAIKIYWDASSVDNNVFLLILTYCGIVLFFVAAVTFLTEVLSERKTPKRRVTRKAPAKTAEETLEE